MPEPTYKRDVYDALIDAIIRLGKNDPKAARRAIRTAERRLDRWLEDRPEKTQIEKAQAAYRKQVGESGRSVPQYSDPAGE